MRITLFSFPSVIFASSLFITPVLAQNESDARLEAQTREMGVAVGNAYACLADSDERREAMKLASKAVYTMILQDLGANLAYAYATSTGYGAGQPRENIDCGALAERWEAIKGHFDLHDLVVEDAE